MWVCVEVVVVSREEVCGAVDGAVDEDGCVSGMTMTCVVCAEGVRCFFLGGGGKVYKFDGVVDGFPLGFC